MSVEEGNPDEQRQQQLRRQAIRGSEESIRLMLSRFGSGDAAYMEPVKLGDPGSRGTPEERQVDEKIIDAVTSIDVIASTSLGQLNANNEIDRRQESLVSFTTDSIGSSPQSEADVPDGLDDRALQAEFPSGADQFAFSTDTFDLASPSPGRAEPLEMAPANPPIDASLESFAAGRMPGDDQSPQREAPPTIPDPDPATAKPGLFEFDSDPGEFRPAMDVIDATDVPSAPTIADAVQATRSMFPPDNGKRTNRTREERAELISQLRDKTRKDTLEARKAAGVGHRTAIPRQSQQPQQGDGGSPSIEPGDAGTTFAGRPDATQVHMGAGLDAATDAMDAHGEVMFELLSKVVRILANHTALIRDLSDRLEMQEPFDEF